jgi:hypothetical protein
MLATNHGFVASQANSAVRTDHMPGHGRSVPFGCCAIRALA